MNNCRKTLPSRSLLEGMPYTNASSTDLRARFDRMKREALQTKAPNVAPIRRNAK